MIDPVRYSGLISTAKILLSRHGYSHEIRQPEQSK